VVECCWNIERRLELEGLLHKRMAGHETSCMWLPGCLSVGCRAGKKWLRCDWLGVRPFRCRLVGSIDKQCSHTSTQGAAGCFGCFLVLRQLLTVRGMQAYDALLVCLQAAGHAWPSCNDTLSAFHGLVSNPDKIPCFSGIS
jgi:hypothetical protein